MYQLMPVLKTLWRSKIGPLLVIIQLSLTIAISSNALFFIKNRIDNISRPVGFASDQTGKLWVKHVGDVDLPQVVARDVERLMRIPGVDAVAPINGVPFSNAGYSTGIYTGHADEEGTRRTQTAVMETNHRAVDALGLRLVEGRSFHAEEVNYFRRVDMPASAQAIVTESIAKALFDREPAVGKTLYIGGQLPVQVVGVVEDFLGYMPGSDFAHYSMLLSVMENHGSLHYVVRTKDGDMADILPHVVKALRELDPERIVDDEKTMISMINEHYANDYAMIVLLLVVVILLILVNVLGIVGITTFWVNQRRRHIGIRRALGATQAAIVQFFLLENTVLVAIATLLGAALAFSVSVELATRHAFALLPWFYVPLAGSVVLLVTLLAAFVPALRGALITPRSAITGN